MVAWRCCICWGGGVSTHEQTRAFDIQLEKELKLTQNWPNEVWVSSEFSDKSRNSEQSPQKIFDSDALTDETDELKRPQKLQTESPSSVFLTEKRSRIDKYFNFHSNRLQQPGPQISRSFNCKLQAAGVSDISQRIRQKTDISGSGDGYQEGGDRRVSYYEPLKLQVEITNNIVFIEKRSRGQAKGRQQPGPVIPLPPSPRKVQRARISEGGNRSRGQTTISDWGDLYEDGGDSGFSPCESSNWRPKVDPGWSDQLDTPENSESWLGPKSCPSSPLKWTVLPGMVTALYLTKDVQRFKMLSLNSSIQEVVNNFLRTGGGPSLPMSYSKFNGSRPKVMAASRMGMSLSDILGGDSLESTVEGIVFSVGCVNTKLCYKMSICQLKHIEKFVQNFPKQSP